MNFLGHKPAGDDLRFSAAESFRLCTQGLRFLEQYESTTSAESLKKADEDLSRCVALYPSDVLPKFYLGSVKTLQGFEGLEEAKSLFSEVIEKGGPALSFAAKYNLAVANVEEYSPEGFSTAEKLLGEVARTKPRSDSSEKMVWAAKATLLYVRADRLWRHREEPTVGDHLADGLELEQELNSFESKLNASQFREDREIRSDVLNVKGTLHEFLYYASSDQSVKDSAKAAAKSEFEQAAGLRVDYVNSMSNLARLKQDVFGQLVEARQMWDRLLETGKSTHYIHYNLGKIDRAEGNTDGAREHFRIAASKIPEAQTALQELEAKATARAGTTSTPEVTG
jgi:tetratricopeptide (TPR) repeat protein